MAKVKTFTSEIKIFQTINELHNLDAQVNNFIKENKIKKIISVSDCATTDNTGATIGIIRAIAYEGPERTKK
jgi:hypothetical protein